ncbi:hypothetical protein ACMFMG_005261 [Clarireedia jacksonii]
MDSILQSMQHPPEWTLEGELQKPPRKSQIHHAEILRPVCTALQIALLNVYLPAGARPSAVVGHSSGEIAAAYAAAAVSMEEAIIVAYYRGFVMRDQEVKGGMAAVGLDALTASRFLRPGVVVACENSPSSTTISGDEDVLNVILDDIRESHTGVLAQRLKVDMAYHSQHMVPLSHKYRELLEDELQSRSITRKDLLVPMFSSVSNERIVSGKALSKEVLTDLPRYPWNHSNSYWYESRVSKAWRPRRFGHHELLGLRVPQTTDNDPVWRVMLSLDDVPWLADHQVKGDIVFPFAAYVSMAGEAFRQVSGVQEGYFVHYPKPSP